MMEAILQLLTHGLIMVVGAICVGVVIDLLTGGRILRRKSKGGILEQAMLAEMQKTEQAIVEAEKVLAEARQWEENAKTQDQTQKQDSRTSSAGSADSDFLTPKE